MGWKRESFIKLGIFWGGVQGSTTLNPSDVFHVTS